MKFLSFSWLADMIELRKEFHRMGGIDRHLLYYTKSNAFLFSILKSPLFFLYPTKHWYSLESQDTKSTSFQDLKKKQGQKLTIRNKSSLS